MAGGSGRPGRPAHGRRARPARAQLHERDDREAQGRDVPPPRRDAAGRRDGLPRTARAGGALPLDAADVPLQRLVLHLGRDGRRWHARVPAGGRHRRDLAAAADRGHHPLQRRTDGAHDDRRGPGRGSARPEGARGHRRRAALARTARAARPARPRRDPPLRADRDVRSDRDQRVAAGVGRPRHRRAVATAGAAGRRQPARAAAAGAGPGRERRTGRRRDHRRARRPRQRRDARATTATTRRRPP